METVGLCDVLLEKAALGVAVLCVVNVFKYFSVDAERELSGVEQEVGGRAVTDTLDKGLSGEIYERPFWTNDTIGGTSPVGLCDALDAPGKGTIEEKSLVTRLTGVGVTGDVTTVTELGSPPDRASGDVNSG